MEEKIEEARDAGYVTTLFNRRRYIPEINMGSAREKQQAERIAINTPVQGSSADLIKIAMINIYKELKEKGVIIAVDIKDEPFGIRDFTIEDVDGYQLTFNQVAKTA